MSTSERPRVEQFFDNMTAHLKVEGIQAAKQAPKLRTRIHQAHAAVQEAWLILKGIHLRRTMDDDELDAPRYKQLGDAFVQLCALMAGWDEKVEKCLEAFVVQGQAVEYEGRTGTTCCGPPLRKSSARGRHSIRCHLDDCCPVPSSGNGCRTSPSSM